MAVTVEDVRAVLNGISEDELSSSTIQFFIDDATALVSKFNPTNQEDADRAILYLAAYKSFVMSEVYDTKRVDGISASRDLARIINFLREEALKALSRVRGVSSLVKQTYMFDERPEDDEREHKDWLYGLY